MVTHSNLIALIFHASATRPLVMVMLPAPATGIGATFTNSPVARLPDLGRVHQGQSDLRPLCVERVAVYDIRDLSLEAFGRALALILRSMAGRPTHGSY